ncbi:hypothetical protein EV128_12798, partial [Rhizobium azibense]
HGSHTVYIDVHIDRTSSSPHFSARRPSSDAYNRNMINTEKTMTEEIDSNPPSAENQQELRTALRQLEIEWRERQKEEMSRRVAENSAAESRFRYRLARAAEGKTVRSYKFHNHAAQLPSEWHAAYQKRIHRDRMRTNRGVTAATVRSWTDLTERSDQEKADHIRKQNRERQARRRAIKANIEMDLLLADLIDELQNGLKGISDAE